MKKWNILKLLISIFLIFILVVFAAVCFLVGTYSGAKFTLNTVKDLVKDTVILDIDLKGGSLYRGFKTGNLYVEVKDIVKVSASSFDIAYDLTDVLVYKYLDVSKLKADNLEVVLLTSDKQDETNVEKPLPEENLSPEKIVFPVAIQIHDFTVNNFHYGMDILDVNVDMFKTKSLGANNYLLYMVDTIASKPVVHLKGGESETDRKKIEKIQQDVTQAISNLQSGKDQTLVFTKDETAEKAQLVSEVKTENAVSGFDDGNGLIEDLPTVNLPFDITLTNIKFTNGRYYQSSFDTGLCDITLSAAWVDTKLYVTQLEAFHELGSVSVTGNMNFIEHFPMEFKLSGQGALNDATEKKNLSDYISSQCKREYSLLSKLFAETNGITIEKYYIAQKIERVKELLIYGELSISEIADKLHYSSSAHLSTQFRSVTGLSPTQFKQLKNPQLKPLDEV